MASAIVQAIGHYGTHGFSSSFDFLDATREQKTSDVSEPLRVLLIHPGDIRHVVTTVARRRRHVGADSQLRPVHFYILENPIEILARELLLLEVLNDYEVPIRQRANVFLEIFGNCKVQDRTARYVEQLGHLLRTLVTNGTGKLEDIIDLSMLRYRERDELETVFKRYSRAVPFDMVNLRDHRMRGYYAERYDNRKALSDWDYYESIRGTASIIHMRQFKDWRDTGVAFEFGDQSYTDPNRTMMSYAEGVMKKGKDQGMKKEVLGYWGDIVASPYFSFGVDCETPNKFAEALFEILNKNTGTEQHRHHAVEIAVYNMLSLLWEIETGSVYKMTKAHDIFSGLGTEAPPKAAATAVETTAEKNNKKMIADTEDGDKGGGNQEGEEQHADKSTTAADDDDRHDHVSTNNIVDDIANLDIDHNVDENSCSTTTVATKEKKKEDEEEKVDGEKKEEKQGGVSPEQKSSSEDEDAAAAANVANVDVAEAAATATPVPEVASPLQEEEEEEEDEATELVKQIQRAQNIVEAWSGIKIFPMLGGPNDTLLNKPKLASLFDAVFVSTRTGHCLDQPYFTPLLKEGAVVAVESSKYIVPLPRKSKVEFNSKIADYAKNRGLTRIQPAPVFRRRRDEDDHEDDVYFFRYDNSSTTDASSASS